MRVSVSKNDIQAVRMAENACIGMNFVYSYGQPIAGDGPNQVLSSLGQLLSLLGR